MALKPRQKTLDERLEESLKLATHGVSLIPSPRERRVQPEEEPIPTLAEVTEDVSLRMRIARLVLEYKEYSTAESEARKLKEGIGAELKALIQDLPQKHFSCAGNGVNYFSTTRTSVDRDKLLLENVSPSIISRCTNITNSYSLRITALSESNPEE